MVYHHCEAGYPFQKVKLSRAYHFGIGLPLHYPFRNVCTLLCNRSSRLSLILSLFAYCQPYTSFPPYRKFTLSAILITPIIILCPNLFVKCCYILLSVIFCKFVGLHKQQHICPYSPVKISVLSCRLSFYFAYHCFTVSIDYAAFFSPAPAIINIAAPAQLRIAPLLSDFSMFQQYRKRVKSTKT